MKYLTCFAAALPALFFTAFTYLSQGYYIKGTVTGLADSTWLYLLTSHPDKLIDSCQVLQGRFQMKGVIQQQATPVYILTKDGRNNTRFWLENKDIEMSLQAGDFENAIISGSATEEEASQLQKLHIPLKNAYDSARKALKATKDTAVKAMLRKQLETIENQEYQTDQNWVRTHPASIVSIHALDLFASTWGRDITQALFNNISAEMKQTQYGKDVSEYLALSRNIQIGGKYADFEQSNTQGKPMKLSQIKGKYVLLDFWASWCGPCRAENPNLVKTYEAYKNKGFAVLGVSLDDDKASWLAAVKQDNLNWENVCDLRGDNNKAALTYSIHSIPTNFLIDENGTIIAQNLRGKKLDDTLKELLP